MSDEQQQLNLQRLAALLLYYFDRGSAVRVPPGQRPSSWLTPILSHAKDLPPALLAALAHPKVDARAYQLWVQEAQAHGYFEMQLGKQSTAVVFSPSLVGNVLENSPEEFATGELQVAIQEHFQPGGLAATTDLNDFQRRRTANESVLESNCRHHSLADRFIQQQSRALGRLSAPTGNVRWGEIDSVCREMTTVNVWGEYDQVLTGQLEHLMTRANLLPILETVRGLLAKPGEEEKKEGKEEEKEKEKEKEEQDQLKKLLSLLPPAIAREVQALMKSDFSLRDAFAARVQERLSESSAPALKGALADAVESGALTSDEAPYQLTHWLFAMRGTVAVTTTYALALLATDQNTQARIVHGLSDVGGIERYLSALAEGENSPIDQLLEQCILEAARLFPPVPLIVRKVPEGDTQFGNCRQLLIHHALNNRLKRFAGHNPQAFDPDRWQLDDPGQPPRIKGVPPPGCTPFGDGGRLCPGMHLGTGLAKALLAQMINRWRIDSVRNDQPFTQIMRASNIPMTYDQFGIVLQTSPRRPA